MQGLKLSYHTKGLQLMSPCIAAGQTAEALSLDCNEDADLRDIDYGDWAGRSISAIASEAPDSLAQWIADPGFAGHGGESIEMLFDRTRSWIDKCANEGSNVIAVTHAAVIRAIVANILGAPLSTFWSIDIAPATVTDIRNDGRRWALRSSGLPLVSGRLQQQAED
nr:MULTISPECIES: histidine phosphatase family protein [Mesorhizobium]